MKTFINELEYKLFTSGYYSEQNSSNSPDNKNNKLNWEYTFNPKTDPTRTTQIDKNKSLLDKIISIIKEHNLNVVVVSPISKPIIIDFDNVELIKENDLNDYDNFNLEYQIKDNEETIAVVISENKRLDTNQIILTDSDCAKLFIINLTELPDFLNYI